MARSAWRILAVIGVKFLLRCFATAKQNKIGSNPTRPWMSCRFREHPVNSLSPFEQPVILVTLTDKLNADGQTRRSGKHRQRDARRIGPGRQDVERGVARAGQSRRSLSESTWREQQVDILHGAGEMS